MLRHLRVTNFAILSDVSLDFADGMNALTGETGAGKSLIVEAVNLLRGGRASADIPRAGADEAVVEAIFDVPRDLRARVAGVIAEAGVPDGDGEVLVRRVIHRGGRSRTYVNGALTTARWLSELGALLVDLSGQHQHQGLVDPRRHREILDVFASRTGGPSDAVARMAAAWDALAAAERDLAAVAGDERAIEDRIDYLRFQLEELTAAAPEPGEDDALAAERARLQSVDRLESGVRLAEDLVYGGDESACDRLAAAARELERLVAIEPALAEPLRQLDEARVLGEEAARFLGGYADRLEGDPERLAQVDDRLALLSRLKRKHGPELADVIERARALGEELAALERRDVRRDELEQEVNRARGLAERAAAALTAARRAAAGALAAQVGAALATLGMGSAALDVVIEPRALGPDGADRVEFLLASNVGEGAKPLQRVASGGELSRIMLALKLCLRRADEVATYVFDEVDTGVGGATADVVGQSIRALADQRQVLCVTHLPQIAAFADRHFQVAKLEVDGRTETEVQPLADADRAEALARMLGGAKLTPRGRAHAEEMLADARARAAATRRGDSRGEPAPAKAIRPARAAKAAKTAGRAQAGAREPAARERRRRR